MRSASGRTNAARGRTSAACRRRAVRPAAPQPPCGAVARAGQRCIDVACGSNGHDAPHPPQQGVLAVGPAGEWLLHGERDCQAPGTHGGSSSVAARQAAGDWAVASRALPGASSCHPYIRQPCMGGCGIRRGCMHASCHAYTLPACAMGPASTSAPRGFSGLLCPRGPSASH